jgi:CBS domain-containing protein
MKLEEIMVREVVTAAPEDSTATAAKLMREKGVGCLVVPRAVRFKEAKP